MQLDYKGKSYYPPPQKKNPASNLSTTSLTLTNPGSNPYLRQDSAKCV